MDEDRRRAFAVRPAGEGPDAVDDDARRSRSAHPPRWQYPRACRSSSASDQPARGAAHGWPRASAGSERDPVEAPSRRRVLAIRDRLREMYGRPVNEPHGHPIAELVRTILSQNTNDRIATSPTGGCATASRAGNRCATRPSKSSRRRCAPAAWRRRRRRGSRTCSSSSATRPTSIGSPTRPASRPSTTSSTCPASAARRRPACSSSPSTGPRSRSTPTSTASAVGWAVPPESLVRRGPRRDARDHAPEDAYELHINLIRHGRALCRPRPRCDECELRRMCPWYRVGRGRLYAAHEASTLRHVRHRRAALRGPDPRLGDQPRGRRGGLPRRASPPTWRRARSCS